MSVSPASIASPRTQSSGLFTLNEDQIAERGARIARRDDRACREHVREPQRSEAGCPAREVVLDRRGQATNRAAAAWSLEAAAVLAIVALAALWASHLQQVRVERY